MRSRIELRVAVFTFLLISIIGLIPHDTSVADEPANDGQEKFDKLAAFVRKTMAETAVPGVAVGILDNGKVYSAGFGITNVEHPLEVNNETLFQVGSITKTFTGTAIMRLVEAGKVDLDAPIRTYLPEFRLKDENAASKATIRHLLTHMGGWVGDLFESTGEGNDALERMVERMADLEQLAPVGTVWSYNNSGFYVAGRVIEVVTGLSYEDALQELVIEPLGLKQTFLRPTDVITRRFVVGHSVSDAGIKIAQPWALPRVVTPAGGAITTIPDLLKYASFHLGDGNNENGERVLTRSSLAAMQAEHAIKVGTDDRMGLTWHLRNVESVGTVSHGGGSVGQISLLMLVPERNFALAIVTNANRGGVVTRKVSQWILKEYIGTAAPEPEPNKATDADLMKYAGLYQRPFADVEVTAQSGQLMLRLIQKQGFPSPDANISPPGPPVAYGLYTEDRIIQIGSPQRGEFIRKPDGTVGWLRIGGRIHIKK